ncbi:3374_t:CDS:1, partial [Acaulospora colombiana]
NSISHAEGKYDSGHRSAMASRAIVAAPNLSNQKDHRLRSEGFGVQMHIPPLASLEDSITEGDAALQTISIE